MYSFDRGPHWEFVDDNCLIVNDRFLRRIRALRDIPHHGVTRGQIGGYVEHVRNLPQGRLGWVADDAMAYGGAEVIWGLVCGRAQVHGDAGVFGNAVISGDAKVYGQARVYDSARVSGCAKIYGDANLSGRAHVCGHAQVYGTAYIGGDACICGDVKVFKV